MQRNSLLFYNKFTLVLYDMTTPCAEFVYFQCKKLNTTTYNSGLVMSDSAAHNVGAGHASGTRHLTSRYTLTGRPHPYPVPLDEHTALVCIFENLDLAREY
jgi:hypothetical protein